MANANVDVKVDFNSLNRKLSSRALTNGRIALANQMLIDMTPFVPMRDSDLRASGHVTSGAKSLEWSELYARAQFYGTNGIVTFRNYHTAGTGARWDEKAANVSMNKWKQTYARGLSL